MLGYSNDGSHFAFEQYGIQDGSGFPFAEIFIVDLVNDAWVSGTPIEVRIDDESASLADAREQAMDQARPKLDALNVEVPVQVRVGRVGSERVSMHSFGGTCCALANPRHIPNGTGHI